MLKKSSFSPWMRWVAMLLCFCILLGVTPALADETAKNFNDCVTITDISLRYQDDTPVPENALLEKEQNLILRYDFEITTTQADDITLNTTKYKLDISKHLKLPDLGESGTPLKLTGSEDIFGYLHSNGTEAWLTFEPDHIKFGIEGAHLYLHCNRAASVPSTGDTEENVSTNQFVMKFENGNKLQFGYWELAPQHAKAKLDKKADTVSGKTIPWTITYTPWQNPQDTDEVGQDTAFEIRDELDTTKHTLKPGSLKVNDTTVAIETGRPTDYATEARYAFTETDGDRMILIIGGTDFKAGTAKNENTVSSLKIEYETEIQDALFLDNIDKAESGKIKVENNAKLFAFVEGDWEDLSISDKDSAEISQPKWIEKKGTTTRNPEEANGAKTEWEITFSPNGFSFDDTHNLTLHDTLPEYSTLDASSVKIKIGDGTETSTTSPKLTHDTTGETESFTISNITTTNEVVKIYYTTTVPESVFETGENLGANTAWFTFTYNGHEYETPHPTADVGSGTAGLGTDVLLKNCEGYDSKTRSIKWKITINPHKANFTSGTFTDDLKIGPACGNTTHLHQTGLMLVDADGKEVPAAEDVKANVQIGESSLSGKVSVAYDEDRILTIKVGDIGKNTLTLTYTTKICDPCVFANNVKDVSFTNTVSTENMKIASGAEQKKSAQATATISRTVLTKKTPEYDYETGLMTWTVEVNDAGLPMKNIILTDVLQEGLTYQDGTFSTSPEIAGATASVDGNTLTIHLGNVSQKTTVTFQTAVDWETLGFAEGTEKVEIKNKICMNGSADEVEFAEVAHEVKCEFINHGLLKENSVKDSEDFIEYTVYINPYRLKLPENPILVDTMDKKLQLDWDSLKFYKATVSGTTGATDKKPIYAKDEGTEQQLSVKSYDAEKNSFTVELPISAEDRTNAYILTYSADIIKRGEGGYGNSVSLSNETFLLGKNGGTQNNAFVAGGGGGGGGGIAARKAKISIEKQDSTTSAALADVTFTLYRWDTTTNQRGMAFAQGTTDSEGKLSFYVSPNTTYELVETKSAVGYGSAIGCAAPPADAEVTENGTMKITTGAKNTEQKLTLTNQQKTADVVFRLLTGDKIPPTGTEVQLFLSDPTVPGAPLKGNFPVRYDGEVRIPSLPSGTYYMKMPDGTVYTVTMTLQPEGSVTPTVTKDGTAVDLNEPIIGGTPTSVTTWDLTVHKTAAGTGAPLSGAKIGLYADDACTHLLKEGTSDANGKVLFKGLIDGQSYYVKETAAPGGYQLSSTIYTVQKANSPLTIENTAIPLGSSGGSGGSGGSGKPSKPNKKEEDKDVVADGADLVAGGEALLPTLPDATTDTIPAEMPLTPSISPAENATTAELPYDGAQQNGMTTPGAAQDMAQMEMEQSKVDAAFTEAAEAQAEIPIHADIPQTGDHTRLFATMTLLSAVALAGLTIYGLRMKKDEEA